MDLLGSILNNMDAPPAAKIDKETQKKVKEAKEKAAKFKAEEKRKLEKFRTETEEQITKFLQDLSERRLKFPVTDKVHRSIIHDVAEIAGLTSFSFGEEDVDRHIVVWKKEFAPSDAELEALRNGEEWNPEIEARLAAGSKQELNNDETPESSQSVSPRKRQRELEPAKYFDKYKKIVGGDSGVDAAKATKVNKAYGMVPSKNKEDQRSIEQTLNELRARKKQKVTNDDKEGSACE